MIAKSGTVAAIVRLMMFGGCWWFSECSGLWGFDEFARYAQRSDRMTTSSGDAKEVNAMAHIPTPWPRGVNDRRIVTDSTHMQRALDRYRRGAQPPDPMPNVPTDYGKQFGSTVSPEQQGQGSATGAPGGGAAAPAPYQAQ
jgi:hypothetical protein